MLILLYNQVFTSYNLWVHLQAMISIEPHELSTAKLHGYLLGAVSPRPICFASTVDSEGNVNLSPFSFFNVFSAKPPILVFSPARRGRDNTTKHTYENVLQVPEVVINIVSFEMVQQMSLSSTEYAKGVNEFKKAGFTELDSDMVKPPRVAEAPVQLECKVNEVIALGKEGGAGNLVICEVIKMHIKEEILGDDGSIDPFKIDTVSRLGGNWYSRAKSGLFEVPKPLTTLGMGVDMLPEEIRNSKVLTGNNLGMLGNVENFPNSEEINTFINASEELMKIIASNNVETIHKKAQELLCDGRVDEAWKVLLSKK
jgi:flavin reductase (DIM6/NTAB) family NADH-FMN oxidoreductase RutF